MRPRERSPAAAWIASILALAAILIHNAATLSTFRPNPSAAYGTIEYGWPLSFFKGSIKAINRIGEIDYGTPRNHWAATNNGHPVWSGVIANTLVAIVLVSVTYCSVVWALNLRGVRLTISTLLGLMIFTGLLSIHEAAENESFATHYPQLFIEFHVFEYVEKLVWLTILVACLWLPNFVLGLLRSPNRSTGNQEMHGSSVDGSILHKHSTHGTP